jgi:galactokinase
VPVNSIAVYAPGRVELLGNHTDYNQGLVLGVAIERGLTVRGERRDDSLVRLSSLAFPGLVEVLLTQLERRASNGWANYPLGVVQEFLKAGYPIGGFTAEISGDLPAGGGLSSSAALEVATALFLQQLFEIEIEPLAIAKICQCAENHFVGVRSGLLDQVSCLFGRANRAVYLDCRSEEIRLVPFPRDLAFVLADSGAQHRLIASDYNTRREECAAAAQALGVASLREVSLAQLQDSRLAISPLLRHRALHVVGENDRVRRALEALACGDAPALGALLNDSHESSRVNFENSTPELDCLVSIARSLPGVLGARLTGGGFGGATLTLVEAARADGVVAALKREGRSSAGPQPGVFACRIAEGAAARMERRPRP